MITNKKATTVRTWFRKLTAARLILLMLTCLPVWGKSPQTVSNQDLMNMKVASASKKELKITQTAPTIYKLYVRHKWYGSSITAQSRDCKSSRPECARIDNARRIEGSGENDSSRSILIEEKWKQSIRPG
jgi:hypothetical protein